VLLDVAVTLTFVLAASAVYVVNDLLDLAHDRQHAAKRTRPLATGEVSHHRRRRVGGGPRDRGRHALAVALGPATATCVAAYGALNLFYSLGLKHVVVLDVCCIAMGYVLRVLAGVVVLGDVPDGPGSCSARSSWRCSWHSPSGVPSSSIRSGAGTINGPCSKPTIATRSTRWSTAVPRWR
jgi:hypothetical protein